MMVVSLTDNIFMKIIIAGSENADKYSIAKELQALNDDLMIAPVFSTNLNLKGKITDDFTYYMAAEEVELSYKNDAFMWVRSKDDESCGVTKPDMYTSHIFVMSFAEFNNMSNPTLKEFLNDNGIICFLDTKHNNSEDDIIESKFACERIFESPYLYFLDEDTNFIVKTVLDYINGDEKERNRIAEELNN